MGGRNCISAQPYSLHFSRALQVLVEYASDPEWASDKCKIDILLPSPTHIAQVKQAKSATKSQLSERHEHVEKGTRTFKTGSPCYALHCGPRRGRSRDASLLLSQSFSTLVHSRFTSFMEMTFRTTEAEAWRSIRRILSQVIQVVPIPHLKNLLKVWSRSSKPMPSQEPFISGPISHYYQTQTRLPTLGDYGPGNPL